MTPEMTRRFVNAYMLLFCIIIFPEEKKLLQLSHHSRHSSITIIARGDTRLFSILKLNYLFLIHAQMNVDKAWGHGYRVNYYYYTF